MQVPQIRSFPWKSLFPTVPGRSATRILLPPGRRSLANGRSCLADFRSDTVTKPTPEVLDAIVRAEVGDDVWGDDPTVQRLEAYVSDLLGHEAALFVTSGTLGNQLAILSWLPAPPHSVILHRASHILRWEAGAISSLCRTLPITIESQTLGAIQEAYVPYEENDCHASPTRLVALENTMDGAVLSLEEIESLSRWVRGMRDGLQPTVPASKPVIHLDGARLWNASVKSGTPLKRYGELVDSTSLCLSKGLGAPVGSVITGTTEMIRRARHLRKMLGGGWRQAGLLAAAGLHVLEHHFPQNLSRDHENAAYLADELKRIGARVLRPVETNMLFVDLLPLLSHHDPAAVEKRLWEQHGLKVSCPDLGSVRLMTHLQANREAIDMLTLALKTIATERP